MAALQPIDQRNAWCRTPPPSPTFRVRLLAQARNRGAGNRTLHGRGPQMPAPSFLGLTYCPSPSTSRTRPLSSPDSPPRLLRLSRGFSGTGGRVYARTSDLGATPANRSVGTSDGNRFPVVHRRRLQHHDERRCGLIQQLLPSGAVRLDDVARYLDLHPKALQRKLTARGQLRGPGRLPRVARRRLLLDTDASLDHLYP